MAKFEVLSENGFIVEGSDDTVHPQGAIVELDPASEQAIACVANGTLKAVEDAPLEETAPVEQVAPVEEVAPETVADPKYVYRGKPVLRISVRTVNGIDHHHVQMETGEELDITDEDYEEMMAHPQ